MEKTKIKLAGTDQEKALQMVNIAKKRIVKCTDFEGLNYTQSFIIEYAKCIRNVCLEAGILGKICANAISKNVETLNNSVLDAELTSQERILYMQTIDNANKRITQICLGGYAFGGFLFISLVVLILKMIPTKKK